MTLKELRHGKKEVRGMEIKNCTAEPNGLSSAKVIEVIETTEEVGRGTPGDPYRLIHKYWSLDGKLLGVGNAQ